jgi:hypothetical protein
MEASCASVNCHDTEHSLIPEAETALAQRQFKPNSASMCIFNPDQTVFDPLTQF